MRRGPKVLPGNDLNRIAARLRELRGQREEIDAQIEALKRRRADVQQNIQEGLRVVRELLWEEPDAGSRRGEESSDSCDGDGCGYCDSCNRAAAAESQRGRESSSTEGR